MWCSLCVIFRTNPNAPSIVEKALLWIRRHTPKLSTQELLELQRQFIPTTVRLEEPHATSSFDTFFGSNSEKP